MGKIKKERKERKILITIGLAVLYFYCCIVIQSYGPDSAPLSIFGIIVNSTIIKGVIVQIQMLISVLFVLLGGRRYYLFSLFINLVGLLGSIRFAVIHNSNTSAPGMLSYTGVIFIISFIYRYKSKLNGKIFELELKEKELRKMAYFDGLTGILNRNIFIEELDVHIQSLKEQTKKMYVIFIDVDNFKYINDTYGHLVGDVVLKELALRIKSEIHEEDLVGRLGGDEIGIMIKRTMDLASVKEYMNHIRSIILNSYVVEGQEFLITVSVGVAEFPKNGKTSLELLRNADIAMYHAKSQGKNRISYFSEEK